MHGQAGNAWIVTYQTQSQAVTHNEGWQRVTTTKQPLNVFRNSCQKQGIQ